MAAREVTVHRGRCARRPFAAAAALLVAGALIGACGGGSSSTPGVAQLRSTSTTSSASATGTSVPLWADVGSPVGSPARRAYTLIFAGTSHQQLLRLAACMRAHGVSQFPDPTAAGVIHVGVAAGLDPASPLFRAAATRCQGDLPRVSAPSPSQSAAMDQRALRYAACMRSHGVFDFPDPRISGNRIIIGFTPGQAAARIVNTPTFERAGTACAHDLPALAGR
jgi:hypothetical protein